MAFDWKTALEVGLGQLGPLLQGQLQRKRASRVPSIEAIRKSAAASRQAGESREEANQRLADVLSMWRDQPKELLTQEFESIYNPNIHSEGYQFWADPTGQWGYDEETGRPEYSIFDAGTGGTHTYDFESFPSQLVPWDSFFSDPRSTRFLDELDRQAVAGSPTGEMTSSWRQKKLRQGVPWEAHAELWADLQKAKGAPEPDTPRPLAGRIEKFFSGKTDDTDEEPWFGGSNPFGYGGGRVPPVERPESPSLFQSKPFEVNPPTSEELQRIQEGRSSSADSWAHQFPPDTSKNRMFPVKDRMTSVFSPTVDPEDAVTAATGAPSPSDEATANFFPTSVPPRWHQGVGGEFPLEPNPDYQSQHRQGLEGGSTWDKPNLPTSPSPQPDINTILSDPDQGRVSPTARSSIGKVLSGDVPWPPPAPFQPRKVEQRMPTSPRFAPGVGKRMEDAFSPRTMARAQAGPAPVEDFGPGPDVVRRRQTQERIPTPVDVGGGIQASARNQEQRGPFAILNQARDPGIGEQILNALEPSVENILNAPGDLVDWVQGLEGSDVIAGIQKVAPWALGERRRQEPSVSRRQTGYDWTAEDTSNAGLDSEMVPLMQAIQTQESSNQHYETRGDAESGVRLGDLDKFPTGSAGLMQVSQGAVDDVQDAGYGGPGREDPAGNQQLGARYLGLQLANPLILEQGGWRAALASYNQGPTSVMEDGISTAGRAYVEKVLSHMGPEARRQFIKWADRQYGGTGVTRPKRTA